VLTNISGTAFIPTQTTSAPSTLTATTVAGLYVTSTTGLYPGMYFWLTGTSFGGIATNTSSTPYQIASIVSSTTITIVSTPPTSTATGTMTFNTYYVTAAYIQNLALNQSIIFTAGVTFGGLSLNTVYYTLSIPTTFTVTATNTPTTYYQYFQIGTNNTSGSLVTLTAATGYLFGFLNSILITGTNTTGSLTISGNYTGYITPNMPLLIPTTNIVGLYNQNIYQVSTISTNTLTLNWWGYSNYNWQSFAPTSNLTGLSIIGIIGATFVNSTISSSPYIASFNIPSYIQTTSGSNITNYFSLSNSIGFIGTPIGGISVISPYYITSIIQQSVFGNNMSFTMTGTSPVLTSNSISYSILPTSSLTSNAISVTTAASVYGTTFNNNYVTVSSTVGMIPGQLISLTGTPFGGLTSSTYSIGSVIDNNNIQLNYVNNLYVPNTTATGNLTVLRNAFNITATNVVTLGITSTYLNNPYISVTPSSLESLIGFSTASTGYIPQQIFNASLSSNANIYQNLSIIPSSTIGSLISGSNYQITSIVNSSTVALNQSQYLINRSYVQAGLVAYYDFSTPASYSGTGSALNDLSGNGYNMTISGTVSFNSTGAISYNPSSSSYATSSAIALNLSSGFTYECLVYFTSLSNTPITMGYTTLSTGNGFLQSVSTTGVFYVSGVGSSSGSFSTAAGVVTTGQWYHLVSVFSSTTYTLCSQYINGVLIPIISGGTLSAFPNNPANTQICLGNDPWNTTEQVNGKFAFGRIYNTALTQSQVLQNYASAYYKLVSNPYSLSITPIFTPTILSPVNYTTTGLIAYYDFSTPASYPGSGSTLYDLSGTGIFGNLTSTGTMTFNSTGAISENIPASGAYWSSASVTANLSGGSSWEALVNISSTANSPFIYSYYTGSAVLAFAEYYNAGNLSLNMGLQGGTCPFYASWTTNIWQHWFFTSTSSGSAIMYLNGAQVATGTTGTYTNNAGILYIGNYWSGSTGFGLNGKIGFLRIYNTALTAAQVQQNYTSAFYKLYSNPYSLPISAYTGSITTPSYQTTGLIAYWDFSVSTSYSGTGSLIVNDLSGNGTNLTFNTTPTYNSTGGISVNFSGQTVTAKSANVTYNFNSTGLTYEMLIYPTTSGITVPFAYSTGNSTTTCILAAIYSGNQLYWYINNANGGFGTTALTVNAWNHAVYIMTPGPSPTYTYYINGTQCGTGAGIVLPTNVSWNFSMGCWNGSQGWVGNFAMARVYNTPLTAAQVQQNYASAYYRLQGNPYSLTAPTGNIPAVPAGTINANVYLQGYSNTVPSGISISGLQTSNIYPQISSAVTTSYISSSNISKGNQLILSGTSFGGLIPTVSVTGISTTGNAITLASSNIYPLGIYPYNAANIPLTLTGTSIGNLNPGTYIIANITNATTVTFSNFVPTSTTTGTMTGYCYIYYVANFINNNSITLSLSSNLFPYFTPSSNALGTLTATQNTQMITNTIASSITISAISNTGVITISSPASLYPGLVLIPQQTIASTTGVTIMDAASVYYIATIISGSTFTLTGITPPSTSLTSLSITVTVYGIIATGQLTTNNTFYLSGTTFGSLSTTQLYYIINASTPASATPNCCTVIQISSVSSSGPIFLPSTGSFTATSPLLMTLDSLSVTSISIGNSNITIANPSSTTILSGNSYILTGTAFGNLQTNYQYTVNTSNNPTSVSLNMNPTSNFIAPYTATGSMLATYMSPVLTSTSNLTSNTFTNIAVVRNLNTLNLYMNGLLNQTITIPSSIVNFTSNVSQTFYIGTNNVAGQSNYFQGFIDNLRYTSNIPRYIGTYSSNIQNYPLLNLSSYAIDGGDTGTAYSLWIGADGITTHSQSGFSNYLQGFIDELRITKGYARYTSNFTPSTIFPVLASDQYYYNTYLTLGYTNIINENSGLQTQQKLITNNSTAFAVTTQNTTSSTVKFGQSSLAFNGTNQYLWVAPSSTFNFGRADFTIELWVYLTSASATYYLMGNGTNNTTANASTSWWISIVNGVFNLYKNGTQITISGSAISATTWYNVAFVRNGCMFTIYVNGSKYSIPSGTSSPSGYFFDSLDSNGTNQEKINIGWSGIQGHAFFSGYIDDLRITKGTSFYNYSISTFGSYQTANYLLPILPKYTYPVPDQNYINSNILTIIPFDGITDTKNRVLTNTTALTSTYTSTINIPSLNTNNYVYQTNSVYGSIYFNNPSFITFYACSTGYMTITGVSSTLFFGGNSYVTVTSPVPLFAFISQTVVITGSSSTSSIGNLIPGTYSIAAIINSTTITLTGFVATTTTTGTLTGTFSAAYANVFSVSTTANLYVGQAITIVSAVSPAAVFGGVTAGVTYYINNIINSTTISLSATSALLTIFTVTTTTSGYMVGQIYIPNISANQPVISTISTYPNVGSSIADYAISTFAFTIEFWIKIVYNNSFNYVISNAQPGTAFSTSCWYICITTTGLLQVNFQGTSYYSVVGIYNSLISQSNINGFTHIALVRNAAGYIYIFMNGILVDVTTTILTGTSTFPQAYSTSLDASGYYIYTLGSANFTGLYLPTLYGYLDDIRVTIGATRYNSQFLLPASSYCINPTTIDPYYTNVALLLKGYNFGLFDQSYYTKTIVQIVGSSTATNFHFINNNTSFPYKFGTASLGFNYQSSQTLQISAANSGSVNDFGVGTNSITVEFWLNVTNGNVGTQYVMGTGYGTGSSTGYNWWITIVNSTVNTPLLTLTIWGSTAQVLSLQTTALTLNTWYFCTFMRNVTVVNNQSMVYLYAGSSISASAILPAATQIDGITGVNIYIGNTPTPTSTTNLPFGGGLDDIRITKYLSRYLTIPPINPITFNTTLFPSAALNTYTDSYYFSNAYVVLLLNCNAQSISTLVDQSYNPKTINYSGSVTLNYNSSYYQFPYSSLNFNVFPNTNVTLLNNASLGYIYTNSSADLAFGTGNVTIEFWIYLTNLNAQFIIGNNWALPGTVIPSTSNNIWYINCVSGALNFYMTTSTPNNQNIVTLILTTSTLSINTWYFITVTRADSLVTIYSNATSIGSNSSLILPVATSMDSGSSESIYIGAWKGNSSSILSSLSTYYLPYFSGYIDDIRITKNLVRPIQQKSYAKPVINSTTAINSIASTTNVTLASAAGTAYNQGTAVSIGYAQFNIQGATVATNTITTTNVVGMSTGTTISITNGYTSVTAVSSSTVTVGSTNGIVSGMVVTMYGGILFGGLTYSSYTVGTVTPPTSLTLTGFSATTNTAPLSGTVYATFGVGGIPAGNYVVSAINSTYTGITLTSYTVTANVSGVSGTNQMTGNFYYGNLIPGTYIFSSAIAAAATSISFYTNTSTQFVSSTAITNPTNTMPMVINNSFTAIHDIYYYNPRVSLLLNCDMLTDNSINTKTITTNQTSSLTITAVSNTYPYAITISGVSSIFVGTVINIYGTAASLSTTGLTFTSYTISAIYSTTSISLTLAGSAFIPSASVSGLTIYAQVLSLQFAYPTTPIFATNYSAPLTQTYTSYSNKLTTIPVSNIFSTLYFSGANLNVAANIDFAMGQGNFTIEFWMAPLTNGPMFITGNCQASTFTTNRWLLLLNNLNYLELWVYNYNPYAYIISTAITSSAVSINTGWTHVAITRSISGTYLNTISIYLNGNLAADYTRNYASTIGQYPISLSLDGGASEVFYIGSSGISATTTIATISATTNPNIVTVNTTVGLYNGIRITLAGTAIGGLATTTTTPTTFNGVYTIGSIISTTSFTVTNSGTINLSSATGGSISINTTGNTFNGFIDDIRVTKGIARYANVQSFTPSANPIFDKYYAQNTSSSSGTTPISISADSYDNSIIPTAINNYNTIISSSAASSVPAAKFGNASYQFVAILQSYLILKNTTSINSNTNTTFTLEFWMYPQNLNGFIIGGGSNGTDPNWWLYLSNNYLYFNYNISTLLFTPKSIIGLNAWHHIAITYNGTSISVYVDGVIYGTGAFTGTLDSANKNIYLGGGFTTSTQLAAQNYYNGYLDNLRLTLGTVRYTTASFTVPVNSFTQDSTYNANVILLLNFEPNNINDQSIYSNAVYQNIVTLSTPSTTQSTLTYPPLSLPTYNFNGSSLYFNGISQYINTASTTDFTVGTLNFTIEFWMNYTVNSQNGIIMGSTSSYWQLSLNNNKLKLQYNATSILNGNIKLNYNVWYNITIIRNLSQLMMYVNGMLDVSVGINTTTVFDVASSTATSIYIGYGTISPLIYYNGYLSELRFTKGIVRYPGNSVIPRVAFQSSYTTPLNTCIANDPYYSNVVLYLNFDNTIIDGSSISKSITNTYVTSYGTATISGTSLSNYQFGTGSYFLNGSNMTLSTPNAASFAFGTNNFTMEFWMFATGANGVPITTSVGINILGNNYNLATAGLLTTSWVIYINTSSKLVFGYGISTTAMITSNISLYYNVWYHIAIVRNNYYFTLFVNGYYDSTGFLSVTSTQSLDSGLTEKITLGYSSNATLTTATYFNGYIDDLRITNGTARYTGNFSLQTAAFPQLTQNLQYDQYFSTNVSLILHFNNNFLNYSVNGILMTNINNVGFSDTVYRFGTASAVFNGNNYLITANSPIYSLGSANISGLYSLFAIEFWINIKLQYLPASGVTGIIGNGKNNTTYGGWYYTISSTGTATFYYTGPGGLITTNGTAIVANGNWNFIQIIRNTITSLIVYVNGIADVSIATLTITNYFDLGTGDSIYLGWDGIAGHYSMIGYMDEFRFTKGQTLSGATIRTAGTIPSSQYPSLPYFGDQYYANVALLCHFQNTILDSGPNAFINNSTMSLLSGTVSFATGISVYGNYSLYLDGNTVYNTGLSQTFTFGTGLFTIEFWMYVPNFLLTRYILSNGTGTAYGTGYQWYLAINTSGFLVLYVNNYTGSTAFITTTAISANCWNHIVITKSTTAGVIYIYANGAQIGTATNAGTMDWSFKNNINIGGANMPSLLTNFIGYLAELRITNGIARYTTSFTNTVPNTISPNFGPQAQMLTDQNNPTSFSIAGTAFDQYFDNNLIYTPLTSTGSNVTNYIDISNSNLTIYSCNLTSNLITIDPTSLYATFNTNNFIGTTSNYLLSSVTKNTGFAQSNATFETWVKFNTVSTTQTFAGNCAGSFSNGTWFLNLSTSSTIQFWLYEYSSNVPLLTSGTISSNIWTHVAVVKNGPSTYNAPIYQYPPIGLSGNPTTTLSGLSYGNGNYVATASSYYTAGPTCYPFMIFDKISAGAANQNTWTTGPFACWGGSYYGTYYTTVANIGNVYGEWVDLLLPNQILLSSYSLQSDITISRSPSAWLIVGTNNGGVTWNLVDSQTNILFSTANQVLYFTPSNPGLYNEYRIIVKAQQYHAPTTGDWITLTEWVLYASIGNYSLYIDGTLTNNALLTSNISSINSTFNIGGNSNLSSNIYLSGSMAGYRMSSCARYLNNFPLLQSGSNYTINSNLNTGIVLYPQIGFNPVTNYQTSAINTIQYDPYYSYTSILSHFEGTSVITNSSINNIIPQYNSLISQIPILIGNSSIGFSNNTQLQYITDTQPILDGISSNTSNTLGGAYSLKRLFTNYNGPVATIRRSSDNATANFYANASTGNLGTYYNGGGFTLAAWASNAFPVYVTKLYNQNGNVATFFSNNTLSTQPLLVSTNNNYYIQFTGTSNLQYSTVTPMTSNFTFCTSYIQNGSNTISNSNIMYQDGIITANDYPQFKICLLNSSNMAFGNSNGYAYQSSSIITNGFSNLTFSTIKRYGVTGQLNLYRGQYTSNISYSNIITNNTSNDSYQLTSNTYLGNEPIYNSKLSAQLGTLLWFNSVIPDYDLAVINSNLMTSNVIQ